MKFKRGLIAIFIIIFALVFYFYLSLLPPSSDSSKKVFVINEGDSLSAIALRLEKNQFIKNRYTFIIYAYLLGLNQKIQAGNFYLTASQKIPDLIKNISRGGSTDYWLKIIPGTRIEQFSPSSEFTLISRDLEGKLFPDSYLIPQDYTPENILSVIDRNYQQKLSQARLGATTKHSDNDVLIIASLLEREAKALADKKIIAGIIDNRLSRQMPLQIDATIQYARDSLGDLSDYWKPISKADINIISPYNTYKNKGLPPAPICNPGLDSLIAAYHPDRTDYLYYIHDSNGQIHYASTLTEHNENIAKYLK
ncbi:MAG TPA: endolytic transglycosylase MltG [Candidatus Woesebacteria bacterium]|nr:endolytic transglycosylase MltG [Candidatus Woesebacteria bacterium]HPR99204.1 endolytic transglycosylase MltG [Candidatus Woesebacteria bacterium]